ncbi:MAG: phage regulatory CII family protein [Planctomycetota bacterium]
MKSHEVLRDVIQPLGAKRIALELRVSSSLVYKWCEEDDDEGSGARNPLDRIVALMHTTKDKRPVEWLCAQAGGTFVPNPVVDLDGYDIQFINHTQQLLDNFSQLLRTMSSSMADDGRVDGEESQRIRREWDRLKGYAEAFVQACERGMFGEEDEEEV